MRFRVFTLIELLIIVAIIGILITLLLPSLQKAREATKLAICKSNQSQHFKVVMNAVIDNDQKVPRFHPHGQANPEGANDLEIHDWYGHAGGAYEMVNPMVSRYAGEDLSFLRCTSLDLGEKHSGEGSNGMFDYTFIGAFSNTFYATLSTQSWMGAAYGSAESVMTPFLVEEDPVKLNSWNIEGAFANEDLLSIEHYKNWKRRGSYTGVDGSNHNYRDPGVTDFRNPYHMWTKLPNDRVDWLQYPVYNPETEVWHKRWGILP